MSKKDSDSYEDYSCPVHTSIAEKKQMFGIGEKAFYFILILTVILASMISVYFIAFGVVSVIICRRLCKNEPLFIEFIFDFLQQQDIYEG